MRKKGRRKGRETKEQGAKVSFEEENGQIKDVREP
jgi:hypothetical protein